MSHVDEEQARRIRQLIDSLDCPKGFRCAKSGFTDLCKARDIGLQEYLVCLEDEPQECPFSYAFADAVVCQCPLRVYIAKNLSRKDSPPVFVPQPKLNKQPC